MNRISLRNIILENIPRQVGVKDCGIFAIMNMFWLMVGSKKRTKQNLVLEARKLILDYLLQNGRVQSIHILLDYLEQELNNRNGM